jgi:uncharacterized membrane protein
MRRRMMVAGLLALSACGGGEAPVNEVTATPTPTPGPKLAGVELEKPLALSGPGWTMAVAPGQITYTPKGDDPVELYPRDPQVSGERAIWTTQTPTGEAVTIDLIAEACDDAPMTAEVKIGARQLKGCAQPK